MSFHGGTNVPFNPLKEIVHIYNYIYVPYIGKLSREKTFTNPWRTRNSQRKLLWIAWRHQLSVSVAVDFRRETFMGRHKTTKFAKVFSLEIFPLYGIIIYKLTIIIFNENKGFCKQCIRIQICRNWNCCSIRQLGSTTLRS